jgi:hypothetical protein
MAGLMGTREAAPQPAAPAPTPMVDEESIRKAKEKALVKSRTRGGRASTVLGGAREEQTLG